LKRLKESQTDLIVQEDSQPMEAIAGQRGKRRANDLDGKTWTKYSISVWSDIKKSPEEAQLGHPAIFPLQLAQRLIECFTTADDTTILDPFAGVGTTVVAANRMNKAGIGIELSAKFCEIAEKRLSQRDLFASQSSASRIYRDDARNLLKYVKLASADMVITSPPYWDILIQKRTADYKAVRHYGDAQTDLGKIGDYNEFLDALVEVFRLVFKALKPNKYCAVVVMDLRKKDRFFPYHADLAQRLSEQVGFIYDDVIVWDRRHEYNNMRPLGYPYVFRVNKAHEYVLIFKKPPA
jgi:DNA modification methylase